jgi:hypothetical protein
MSVKSAPSAATVCMEKALENMKQKDANIAAEKTFQLNLLRNEQPNVLKRMKNQF